MAVSDKSISGPFSLQQNYPNPFNPATTIVSASAGETKLSIHNAAGQPVASLIDGFRRAGTYRLRWDGRDDAGRRLASGMYFYRLSAGTRVEARELLLLR